MKGIFLKIHNWDSTPNAARDESVFALCQKLGALSTKTNLHLRLYLNSR